jgi:CBS domain containing-hemolysin-like protein
MEAARAEIARFAGTQFDPRAAEAFLSMTEREITELARPALFVPESMKADALLRRFTQSAPNDEELLT